MLVLVARTRWKKGILTAACLALFTFLSAAVCWGAVPERVKVTLSPGTNTNTSKINMVWTGWDPGDQIARSLDGLTWDTLSASGTFPGGGTLSINGSDANYVEDNFTNWNLVYFKIIGSGGFSKRINIFPPIEHGHANYSDNTNQCKVCHITHTAQSARLLATVSVKNLCYTCHGIGGTGSRYNVEKGWVLYSANYDWTSRQVNDPTPAYRRALGGPFDASVGSNDNPQWNNVDTSSSHDIDKEDQILNAPGGGGDKNMSCISCHNAHASNENYRLLNTPFLVDAYASINTAAVSDTDFREKAVYYNNGMNKFCSSCHGQFDRGQDSGHTTTDAVYRHATEVDLTWNSPTGPVTYTTTLPTYIDRNDGNQNKIFCLTCHYAHGTNAQGLNPSVNNPAPGGSTVLKRLDNMATCEECHKK